LAPSSSEGETGDAAQGLVGTVGLEITVALTGVEATGEPGFIVPALGSVQAEGTVGDVGISVTVALTGVVASGTAGDLIDVYWKVIDDSETANWQNVSNSQGSGWALVDDSQTTSWGLIDTVN
jgi:hypothetical protein